MKKYLITEKQRNAILSIPGYMNLKDEIAAIKPIEPLSGEQIDTLLVQHGKGDDGFNSFAHAIERHILGSEA